MKKDMRNEGLINEETMADDSMEWVYGEESMPGPVPIEVKEHIAEILSTSPEALDAFEDSYRKTILKAGFDVLDQVDASGKEIRDARKADHAGTAKDMPEGLVERIVAELMEQSSYIEWDGEKISYGKPHMRGAGTPEEGALVKPVTRNDLLAAPPRVRPQLAGNFIRRDMAMPTYPSLLEFYEKAFSKGEANPQFCWHLFRQGLDILDLDPVLYAILGTNKNAIGHWLPPLAEAVTKHGFFEIPKTRVIKVPMQMLQLSRLDDIDTDGTLAVVDRFCFDAFELDENKDYFVKTGTYSSKFDFRNAHVHEPKEVRELGEYLLYIQSQAVRMAGPHFDSSPSVYGVSTTNEWAVREYIPDPENSPTIYKGLPLRTEYRVFIDCDTDEVIGMSPYWEPEMMKKRFGHEADAASPHQFHDYVTFCAAEPKLMERYHANKDNVRRQVEAMLPDLDLEGQWSLDIMQSGDTFYVIDMALASTSALRECVPADLLKPAMDISLPRIPEPKADRDQIGQAEG